MPDCRPGALLIEGDCLNAMQAIPNQSIHFILCDLPYGTTQNKWDSTLPLPQLWKHYERILAPRGAVALMSQGSFTAQVISSGREWFKYKIVWIKSKATNFLNAKKQPLRKHEDICIFYKEQPHYIPQMSEGEAYDKGVRKNQLTGSYGDFRPSWIRSAGTRYPTDVVYFKTAEAEGKVWHPTQKPVELGRYLIRTYTSEDHLILDHCFGSGSFLVSAALEGRTAIGIEKNSSLTVFKKAPINMLDIAMRRLKGAANAYVVADGPNLAREVKRFIESQSCTRPSNESSESYVPSDLDLVV